MSSVIAMGSGSTAMAAILYYDYKTTHSLSKFLVVEEEGKQPYMPTKCRYHSANY